MRKNLKNIWLIAFLVFFTQNASTQFTLGGEFRPRTEYSHGHGTLALPGQKASLFTSQRTRLNFHYETGKLKTGLVLQDVRLWGSQSQLTANEDFATSVHEGWLEFEAMENLFLKAGRMELAYDNHRILGNVGWGQQGRSHDLFLLKYEREFSLHAGFAYHENSDRTNNFYFGPDAYKAMQFFWAHRKLENMELSFLFLNNGIPVVKETNSFGVITKQGISYSQTLGPFIKFKGESSGAILSLYFQGGKDGSEKTLRAGYANLEGYFSFTDKIVLTSGYEVISGTPYDETQVNRSFSPFYGTNHRFNGTMDYFFSGSHLNNVGLSDLYFKGKRNFKSLSVNADLHFFHSAAAISPDANAYLGTELDLSAGWQSESGVGAEFGYSQLFAGESMELLKGGSRGEIQNWAWVMLTVKPTFFKSENK